MTPAQNKKLFAVAHERGKSIDDLRDMTPLGSVRALSVEQAAILIDSLERGISPGYAHRSHASHSPHRRPRLARGVVRMLTPGQRSLIATVLHDLEIAWNWNASQVTDWLAARHGTDGTPMNAPTTSAHGVQIIEMLYSARDKARAAREASNPAKECPHAAVV